MDQIGIPGGNSSEWVGGIVGIRSMIADAWRSADEWDQFLEDFVSDPATIEIVKAHKLDASKNLWCVAA